MNDPQSIDTLDNFIEEINKKLPKGYKFSFFVTKKERKFLMGVWFLTETEVTSARDIKKEISSEKARITKKLKQA